MELRRLSNWFYIRYSNKDYPNILVKQTRAYAIYELEIGNNRYGIPVKTNIKHSSGFFFKESGRKKSGERPGLDFKYSVVVNDDAYLDGDGHIDEKELRCLVRNEDKILKEFKKYLNGYLKFIKNPIGKCWDSWKYSYTSLEYFWDELGVNIIDKESKKNEIRLAYNIYLIIKNLCKDSNAKIDNFFIRKTDNSSVSISYLGCFLLKNFKLDEINKYIDIVTMHDSNGDVNHEIRLGSSYSELLCKLKEKMKTQ